MIGDADVISIKRKPKPVTKKPKMELYPIAKVEIYSSGKVSETYWVVTRPDGKEVQCSSYRMAEKEQQRLDKKGNS